MRTKPRTHVLLDDTAREPMTTIDAVGPMTRQRCTAHSTRTGKPCQAWAVRGATVCSVHGGRAPQVRQAANRRLALGEAIAELDRLGRTVDVDPAEAMLDMVREAAANVAIYRRLVQQLRVNHVDPGTGPVDTGDEDSPTIDDIDRSVLGASIAGRVDPGNWKAAPHVFVVMYDEERERLVRWSKMCRDAGVEERQLELAQEDGRRLVDVLLLVTDELLHLLAGHLDRELVDRVRRDEIPRLMRQAIDTTGADR